MASKSFTALPSVVSVVAEKTVVAMRCHTRGFEKIFWPIVAIILTVLALICFAVAAGTPMWVQINLNSNVANSTTNDNKGYISFGIFSGSHVIELREEPFVDSDLDSYFVFERYTSILTSRLYATFAFSVVAMLLCIVLIVVTFLNSYQTVTTWWKGPPMMYIISLLVSLFAFTAVGLFADFYLWDLDNQAVFVDSYTIPGSLTSSSYLLSYERTPTLHYSFGLQVGGSFLPLMVLLISWRLMLLLPVNKTDRDEPAQEFEMQTSEGESSMLPTSQMAMSMNAAAAGPIAPVPPPGVGRGKGQSKFVTGEGGLLY